jgi:hypothetical protein
MEYDSSGYLCRRCLPERINEKDLREYLDTYAASLGFEVRAPEAEYKKRLALCDSCPHRIQFTCTQCGCYVQARAAKKNQKCPLPGSPRWAAYQEEKTE